MPLSLGSIVQESAGQVACDLAGETVILALGSGVYYGLDPVGSRIWALLHEPTSVASIRDTLLAEYAVDAARCESDLLALLEQLTSAELITPRDAPAA